MRRSTPPFVSTCLAAVLAVLAVAAFAVQAADVRVASEYWATRQGVSARVLLLLPPDPRAAVMLLPGGHGNLNLDVQAQIGWGQDDFVIRTRASYPQAGFATIVPDIAVDRKPPAELGDYRRSELQAADLRALSDQLRRKAEPVFMVAYDRGATSALNAAGRGRLDLISGLVLISPILETTGGAGTILDDGARLALDKLPVLLISHGLDECSAGAVKHLQAIAAAKAARDFQPVSVTGGSKQFRLQDPLAYPYDPCNRQAPHAMAGLEARVSTLVIDWLEKQQLTKP